MVAGKISERASEGPWLIMLAGVVAYALV